MHRVLMLAWMDAEALRRTRRAERATYWSRSRQAYWVKGETSGNTSMCASSVSTATATPCCSWSTRSAPPATPAPRPASTGGLRESPLVEFRASLVDPAKKNVETRLRRRWARVGRGWSGVVDEVVVAVG